MIKIVIEVNNIVNAVTIGTNSISYRALRTLFQVWVIVWKD